MLCFLVNSEKERSWAQYSARVEIAEERLVDGLAEKLRGSVREYATGEWSQPVNLVSAAVQSIALAPGTYGAQKWHLSWTQGTSLKFARMNVSASPSVGTPEVVTTVSSVWYFDGPSVVGLGGQYNGTGIVWREWSDEALRLFSEV